MTHPIEQAADAVDRELADLRAKLAVAVEALTLLQNASGETARMGAVTGPHWTRLTIALLKSRAALAQINTQGEHK